MKSQVITVSSFALRPADAGATLEYCDEWFCECFFRRPSVMDATQCSVVRKVKNLAPLTNAFRFTTKLYHAIICAVSVLLNWCRPATILWFVIAFPVWVSVKRMIRGRRSPNVFKEVFKCYPSLADFNARATVPFVACASRIKAPLFHHCPNRVLAAVLSVYGFSVFPLGFFGPIYDKASTASRATIGKVGAAHNYGVSALALTAPHCVVFIFDSLERGNVKPSEFTANKIKTF